MTTIALAGDTMLGRLVGEHLATSPAGSVVDDDLLEVVAAADATVLNLECCISERGEPWPHRVFHFRAPPAAVDVLALLGVRAVTLANNHAMDYGEQALLDTLDHLARAGIATAGAGRDAEEAAAPARVVVGDLRLTLVSLTDDPPQYAAGPDRPGVAWVDLAHGVPAAVVDAVRALSREDGLLLVSPHWGPNMVPEPLPRVRRAAEQLVAAGAGLVAGHSAHVVHGVAGRVLFDLGDLLDDYAVGPLRNDLGLLWLVSVEHGRPTRLEAVPLRLGFCRTGLARGDDARWMRSRFRQACADLGTDVAEEDGRLVVDLGATPAG